MIGGAFERFGHRPIFRHGPGTIYCGVEDDAEIPGPTMGRIPEMHGRRS